MLPAACRKHLSFILIFLFTTLSIYAQDTLTTENRSVIIKDSSQQQTSDAGLTKSPMGAVWRSLVFPGWGQLYVESYWKIPIFVGGVGVSIYFIVWNNQKFKYYQSQYDEMKVSDPDNTYELERLKSQKEYYRDNRDRSYFFLGITYILAAVDAYVGANLFDFDVNDNLQMRLMPYYDNQFGLNFSLRIK